MVEITARVREENQNMLDDKDNGQKGNKRSIFYELRDNQNLPALEKKADRLEDEGVLLVMTGTEFTAKSIAITHFHLLNNPS
ncbi:hypothetical protein G7Y89_g3879 [Cudoniella acicularis]|uniref:Uncharacterized protein n=1 Tax=Cudoniella acicularis TaxID=354080 RepID=A0A8H4W576_9HELO|nr:hypothetical protein G7Y89_g3879 [Cudoniella acicularis]